MSSSFGRRETVLELIQWVGGDSSGPASAYGLQGSGTLLGGEMGLEHSSPWPCDVTAHLPKQSVFLPQKSFYPALTQPCLEQLDKLLIGL